LFVVISSSHLLVSYRFLYEEVFVGRPHALYVGRGARGPVVVAVEAMTPNERRGDRSRFRVLALDKSGYHKVWIVSFFSCV
jgi:hypothetical protein